MAIRRNILYVNAIFIATKAILHHSVLPFTPSERRPYPKKLMDKKPVKERISEKDWEKLETKRLEEELENHKDCYTTVQGQHQHCPEGEDSWCKWKKTEREKAEREKEKEIKKIGMETATEKEDKKEEKEKKKKEQEEEDEVEALAKRGLAHCF